MAAKRKYTKKVIVRDEKSTPEARAKRVKKVRNLANLTRKQMCEGNSININTLKGWEIARYGGLPVDGSEKIVERVKTEGVVCTADWLIYEIGTGPYVIPNFHESKRDLDLESEQPARGSEINEQESLILNELLLFREQFSNTTAYQVSDDGLSPAYQLEDYVAGIKRHRDKITTVVGQDCIVQTDDGKTLLRNLRQGSTKGKFMLVCTNHNSSMVKEPVLYDVKLIYAAPVIRHYHKDNLL